MVWGMISYHGRSNLLQIEGNLNSNRYVREVLQPEVVPFLQGSPGAIFQQDNAHLHVAKTARLLFSSTRTYYGLRTLPWSHHHMITVSKDGCIRISFLLDSIGHSEYDLTLHKHGDVINSVRIFGKQFAACSRDNTVTLWDLDVLRSPYLHLKATLLHTIIGPAEYIADTGFWNNKVCT
ncbi:UNVERIFIED_CONTAM: hypothetical protein NCL1_23155 [Trichonephila clavipes]